MIKLITELEEGMVLKLKKYRISFQPNIFDVVIEAAESDEQAVAMAREQFNKSIEDICNNADVAIEEIIN